MATSTDAMWRLLAPMWPCHITDPWERLHKASPSLIQCRFDQWTRWSGLGSMGPLSSTWKAPTDLQTAFLPKQPTYMPCDRHLESNQGPKIKRRWNPTSADALDDIARCPRHSNRPTWWPISAPTASTHYKRGSGVRWRSAPYTFKHSKLGQAL
jgi:hypothetical protein